MNQNKRNQSKIGFTRADVEMALHQLAKQAASSRPKTDQEIVQMLENLDLSGVPKPDPKRFERLIQERLHGSKQPKTLVEAGTANPAAAEVAAQEELALAARSGKKMTEETNTKVLAATQRAMSKNTNKSNDTPSK